MSNEKLKKYVELYRDFRYMEEKQKEAREKLFEMLNKLTKNIVIENSEQIEIDEDDISKKLPCLYIGLKIKDWHIKESSAYVFLNILNRKVGILLNGYQDEDEMEIFLNLWNNAFKEKYKVDSKLISFTWADELEDEDIEIDVEYFKAIKEYSGKSFSPDKIDDFEDNFYWGYQYDFDIDTIQSNYETIAKDFKQLLVTFNSTTK